MALLTLPPPQGVTGPLGQYLARLNQTLIRAFTSVVTQDAGAARIMLTSPNKTVYIMTVEDDGTLRVRSEDGLT